MPPKNNITLENIQELLEKQKKDIISEIKSDLNEKIKLLEERVGESDKLPFSARSLILLGIKLPLFPTDNSLTEA